MSATDPTPQPSDAPEAPTAEDREVVSSIVMTFLEGASKGKDDIDAGLGFQKAQARLAAYRRSSCAEACREPEKEVERLKAELAPLREEAEQRRLKRRGKFTILPDGKFGPHPDDR